MIKHLININVKEKEYLKSLIESDRVSTKTKLKAKVLLLRALKKDISTIISETNLSKRTIINYINSYIECSSHYSLFKNNYNKSELFKYKEVIRNEFKEKPPLTYNEGALRIEKITGIRRSLTQIRNFFNNNNIYTRQTLKKAKIYYSTRRKIEAKFKSKC